MNKYEDRVNRIVEGLSHVAEVLQIHPSEVTKAQFLRHVDNVTPWDIHEVGGLGGIKRTKFPIVSKDLATIRETKETNKYISELEKIVGNRQLLQKQAMEAIDRAVKSVDISKLKIPPKPRPSKYKVNMTMEALLSDIHYGKKTKTFNAKICRERIREFANVFLQEYRTYSKLFNVERFIIALIGDIIESYTMHGMESSLGCEFGNSEQIELAIDSLFEDLIVPIASTGVLIDLPCVPGNHDRTDNRKTYVDMGKNHVTWIIYNVLEKLCKKAKIRNVNFIITPHSYAVLDIYGNNCLYEHGDEAGACTKNAFEAIMNKRSKQEGKIIHFGRFGHWHEYTHFDRGRIIVNESVCGQDGYTAQKGFTSECGQTINYYIKTNERPTCFYHSFPVYLGTTYE